MDEVAKSGWALIASDEQLVDLAAQLGVPVPARVGGPLVSELRVEGRDMGHPNSLTSRYGTGRFPYHTDGAHFREVPRFLLLRLAAGSSSSRPTELFDLIMSLDESEKRVLRTERWKFGSGAQCVIGAVLSSFGLRYDTSIMRPAVPSRSDATTIVERAIGRARPAQIYWVHGCTAIIDNHRMLHARAMGSGEAEDRILERALVVQV